MRYYAISDESRVTDSRFRSIAAVSLPVDEADGYNERVAGILRLTQVSEFKWHDLNSAKRRFCAIELLNSVFNDLLLIGGRVDVVVWDTQDSRHCVPNRDDDKNFERMYFHLHKTVMLKRQPDAHWHLRPDERFGINWDTLHDCLKRVGSWRKYYERTLLSEEFSLAQFHVRTLKEVRSCDLPSCQVADLMAGMAAYTRARPHLYNAWCSHVAGQVSLLSEAEVSFSNVDRQRLPVIVHMNQECKARSLGVSLATNGYLLTHNPSKPVNFWHYSPQHLSDRAPTRST